MVHVVQKLTLLLLGLLMLTDGEIVSLKNHPCARECQVGDTRVCKYNFSIEWYRTLSKACFDCPVNMTHCYLPRCISGDGTSRAVVAVNRQIPGPTIEVCQGDTVDVSVYNQMEDGEATAIHWHGIHMRGTPHMDGVPMLTQCPIIPLTTFVYQFTAARGGTYWYHSHSGVQREDGFFGAFIIKLAREQDPHSSLYDHDLAEHVVILNDWHSRPAIQRLMDIVHGNSFDPGSPPGALINGKNRKYDRTTPSGTPKTPLEVFKVEKGKRYRFRLIHAGGKGCVFKVSVDSHKLKVIALDGANVQSVEVDTFAVYAGERYDFILEANRNIGNYWFRTKGFIDCASRDSHVHAIVRYSGAPEKDPTAAMYVARSGKFLNPILFDENHFKVGAKHGKPYDVSLMDLNSYDSLDLSGQKADVTYYTGIDVFWNDNTRGHHPVHDPARMRDTIYRQFSSTQDNPEDVEPRWLCNKSTVNMDECYRNGCRCTYVVNFKYGQIVDVVTVYLGTSVATGGHPMHLHGQHFRLLAHGKLNSTTTVETVKRLYEEGKLPLKMKNSIEKDTIDVPDGGYVVFRITTNNPGYWFYHCSEVEHTLRGQGLVFKVGERSQMAPNPPNFPRCGGWGYNGAPQFCRKDFKHKKCTSGSAQVERCWSLIITLFTFIISSH